MTDHYILDASNNELTVTNLFGSNNSTYTLGSLPLGTVGNTATGELGTKVIVIGGVALGAGTAAIGTVQETQSSTAPSSFAVRTANETVFTLTEGQRGFIQNLDTDTLLVKYGASAALDSFNFVLKGSAVADDGSGGYLSIENWVGAVSVIASTGTARYLAWKI